MCCGSLMRIPQNSLWTFFYYVQFLVIKYYFDNFNSFRYDYWKKLFSLSGIILVYLYRISFIRVEYINALITWYLFSYILLMYFKDVKKIPLIFSLVVFYSELYEVPIYVYRLMYNIDTIDPIVIIIKLSFIVLVQYLMMGEGYRDYVRHILMFIIPFTSFGFLLMVNIKSFGSIITIITLKLICLYDLIYYLNNK